MIKDSLPTPDEDELCSECGEPIGDEWITTSGFAHPTCAEELYALDFSDTDV
jgi:hypothetical protein